MSNTEYTFDSVVREFFDVYDTETRHYILSLDEAEQNTALSNLTSKLYDKIVEKVDQIDFGTIPKSKGDITKIDNYASLIECINIMKDIVKQYNQSTEAVDTVLKAVENIKNRERMFSKAFAIGKEYPMVIYNTMVLSIVTSVSFLISTCIEFVKTPGNNTFEMALDKTAYNKSMNAVLFKNLKLFNESCRCGDMDKSLELIMQVTTESSVIVSEGLLKKATKETVKATSYMIAAGYIFINIIKNIIPMLRELVFYFFNASMKVSDYFAIQSDLLEMNANGVIYRNDISETEKTNIIKKQNKIAERFKKVSNFFDISNKKAEKEAAKASKETMEKLKKEDLNDSESLF